MSQQVFGVIGAAVGFYFGGVAGAVAGYAIGSGALLPKAKGLEGPSLSDLKVTGSSYGTPIPWLRGAPRVSGSLWWASNKRKISSTTSGGKGSGPKVTTSTYEVDVMFGLCENEIQAISRIWSNGKLVYTKRSEADSGSLGASEATDLWRRFTFYPGSATQLPDPTYEAAVGTANAPAYRGRAYAFFEGLQLGSDGQIPNLTFEVAQLASEAAGQRIVGIAATGGPVFQDLFSSGDGTPAIVSMFPTARVAVITVSGTPVVYEFETATGAYIGTSTRSGASEAYPEIRNPSAPSTPSWAVGVLQGQPIRAQKQLVAFGTPNAYIVTAGVASGYPAPSSGYDFTTLLPSGRYLGFVTLCSDGQHILIGSAPNDTAYSGSAVIDRWDLLQYNGTTATVVRTGTLQASMSTTSLAFGNCGAPGYHYTASMLSNDLQTVWAAIGSGDGPVVKYVIGADDVLREVQRFRENPDGVGVIDRTFTYPSLWAQDGLCVVVAKDSYMLFGSNSYDVGADTLRATVEALCARAGMPAGTYDASALASITKPVRALAVADVSATRGTLEQLAAAYFFDCTLADKLYFRPRGGSAVATIPFEDLGAGPERAAAEPLALVYGSDLELPPQVFVSYINVSDDNQAGSEGSSRIVASQAAAKTVQLALGFTPAEAKGIADALVVDGLSGLVTSNIALPLNYSRLEPGDVVNVLDEASTAYRMRLLRRNEASGVLSFEAAIDDSSAFTSSQITSGGYTPSNTVEGTSATLLQLLDIPLLRDADDGPGYYVAAKGAAAGWPGAAVQSSLNNTDFDQVAEISEVAVFGTCTTTLGNYTGVGFDEVNSVTVNVGTGELASSTRDAMLADETINAMLIGSEVVRFRTATGSAGAYVLTGLLRGQRGTEWAMAGHVASERCVLLQARGMRRVTTQTSDTGQVRYVKGVTLGALASSATATSFTNTSAGQRPLAPVDLRVFRDSTGNFALSWRRRSRMSARFLPAAGVPLGESTEAYEIRVVNSGSGAVLDSLRVNQPGATYSVAQQARAGVSSGTVIRFEVAQVSAAVGRGQAALSVMSASYVTMPQITEFSLSGSFAAGVGLQVKLLRDAAVDTVSYSTVPGDASVSGAAASLGAAIDALASYSATVSGPTITVTGPVSASFALQPQNVLAGFIQLARIQKASEAVAETINETYELSWVSAIGYTSADLFQTRFQASASAPEDLPVVDVIVSMDGVSAPEGIAGAMCVGINSNVELQARGIWAAVISGRERNILVSIPASLDGQYVVSRISTNPGILSYAVQPATAAKLAGPARPQISTATVPAVTSGNTYRLAIDLTQTASVVAGGGDTPASVAASLAALVDAMPNYISSSSGAVVTITHVSNNVPFSLGQAVVASPIVMGFPSLVQAAQ